MDVEGGEYNSLEEILSNYHSQITGIVLEIHFDELEHSKTGLNLLKTLSQNFVLLNVRGNNCVGNNAMFISKNAIGLVPKVIGLTYINKNLVTDYKLSSIHKYPSKVDMPNCYKKSELWFKTLTN